MRLVIRAGAVRWAAILGAVVLSLTLSVPPMAAQGITDIDYEDLTLRGVMVDAGRIFPNRVDGANSLGGRIDLGFLTRGVRATFGVNRWSSSLLREEVGIFEDRLEELVFEQTGTVTTIDLGEITWSDTSLHGDAHLLWRVPMGVLTYAGFGASVHFLNGGGSSIEDTFIEDLLDSVRAGGNVHTGVEIPITGRLRIVGEARYEILENLRYTHIRVGGQFTFGALVPGEG
jgi:hypothetical protein